MRKRVIGGTLALIMAMTPLAVMAQVAPLDEESRASVVAMAQRVGQNLASGAMPVAGGSLPFIVEDPGAPNPQAEEPEPEPTDEPTDEPLALPELNLTDLVEYSHAGVTFQAPADWIVDTDLGDDTPFLIEVPGTGVVVSMEADAGLDFPSMLGVALFRSQADVLISELGADARLDESATIFTEQNVPIAKMVFSGAEDGGEVGGALYVLAPNENAYIMIGGGPIEEWDYAAPGIELIAASIVFDEDLITLQWVESEPLLFTDEDATMEVTVPAGWYVMSTGDPQFPVIVAEREVRYVAALGTEATFGDNFDTEALAEFIPESGELDAEQSEELMAEILSMVDDSGSPILVDEELSSFSTREGAITVRLVGDADLGDGMAMPVIFYIDLKTTGAGIVALFGDTGGALEVEEQLRLMLESITGLGE